MRYAINAWDVTTGGRTRWAAVKENGKKIGELQIKVNYWGKYETEWVSWPDTWHSKDVSYDETLEEAMAKANAWLQKNYGGENKCK